MKYVIIGNSAAAIACAEGIRSVDAAGEIVMIASEKHHCYGRPLISYVLLGRISRANVDYRPRGFYNDNNIKTMFGRTVTSIDAVKKFVSLENGERVDYDRLLVATGSRPFVPPTDGLDEVKDKFTFMTLDDMDALEAKLTSQSRVLVVGAGLIGLKCVEGILDRVKSVTVVDMADRILPSILDGGSSAIVRASLEKRGVKFILNDCVEKFGDGVALLKNCGQKLAFDILVTAVGVRPNVGLVKDAGGEVGRGILIDERMRTSLADVYAAGDCTEGYDMSVGSRRVLALLPNAYMQGLCAGLNMAGGSSVYDNAIPMNAVGFFDCHVVTAGNYEGELIERADGEKLKRLYIKDGKLAGFILINDIARAGIYTSLIRGGVPLSSVNMELLVQAPQLLAFSREERKIKLGTKV